MTKSIHMLTSSAEMKLFAGVAIQPFLASACAFFIFPVLLLDEHGETLAGGRPGDPTEAAISVALVTGVVALFVAFAGACTAAVLRTRRGFVPLGEALLFGLGFGNLPYVILAVAAGGTYGFEGLLRGVAFSSVLGLTGATTFWAIALRRQRSTTGVAGLHARQAALCLAMGPAVMAFSSCAFWPSGPSKSVAGEWQAPGIGHLGSYFQLSLTQSGDRISGVACANDVGYLLFHDTPVTGDYPQVAFVVPASGESFSGKFEDDRDQIAGEYGRSRIPLWFTRSGSGRCEGARPLP